jgi:beta-glucanase (GH16 family)
VAVEWTPASVSYFVDGSLVSTTTDAVPAVDHALSIRYDASATTIASNVSMQVDYVKVWEYVSGC